MKTRKFLIQIIILSIVLLVTIELILAHFSLINDTIFNILQDIYISLGITFFIYIAEYLDFKRNIISKIFEEILRIYRNILMIKTTLNIPNASIEKVKSIIQNEFSTSITNLKIITGDYTKFFNKSNSCIVKIVNTFSNTLVNCAISMKSINDKEELDKCLNQLILDIKQETHSIKQLKEHLDEADGMNPILFDIYNNKKSSDEILNIFKD